mmetsp:Transcript_4286/g.7188  ORF Transcript_4286/g.7188 Transcript_4286/m.7188 type:complete len:211 (-) Transcript_4286:1864-2496(-)
MIRSFVAGLRLRFANAHAACSCTAGCAELSKSTSGSNKAPRSFSTFISASLQTEKLTTTQAASCCTRELGEASNLVIGLTPSISMIIIAKSRSKERFTRARATASCTDSKGKDAHWSSGPIPCSATTLSRLTDATARFAIARAACISVASSLWLRLPTSTGIAPSSPISSLKSSCTAKLATAHSDCMRTPSVAEVASLRRGATAPALIMG